MNELPETHRDAGSIDEDELLDREIWEGLSVELIGLDAETRLDALERHEVDPEVYSASERHWIDAMMDEIMAGDPSRAEHYGLRCSEELARRKSAAPDEAGDAAETPRVARAPADGPAAVAARGDEVPTYLRAPLGVSSVSGATPLPVAPPPVAAPAMVKRPLGSTGALETTATGVAAPRPTMPFVPQAPGAPPPVAAAASRPATKPAEGDGDQLDRTLEAPDAVLGGPVLPFAANKKEGT